MPEQSCLLWVSAGPGCGKSVLARSLIDEGILMSTPTTHVCYFFFKDTSHEARSAVNALRSLLHQLFRSNSDLLKHAVAQFHSIGPQLASNPSQLLIILENTLNDTQTGEIIWILDALDECPIEERRLIVQWLQRIFDSVSILKRPSSNRFKCIVTGRPYELVGRDLFQLRKSGDLVELHGGEESASIYKEIEHVIDVKVPEIAGKLNVNKDVENIIREGLLKVENKTYLWLHLMIQSLERIKGSVTPKRVRQFLSTIPTTVYSAYEDILTRNDTNASRAEATKLLQLVLVAERPLTVAELNIAFHLEGTEGSVTDIDKEEDERFKNTSQDLCGLMICFVESKAYLLHQSVKDFLLRPATLPDLKSDGQQLSNKWQHSLDEEESQKLMAFTCLKYMCILPPITSIPIASNSAHPRSQVFLEEKCNEHSLLLYSSLFWPEHVRGQAETSLAPLLDEFLDVHFPLSIFARIALSAQIWSKKIFVSQGDTQSFSWFDMAIASAESIQHRELHTLAAYGLSTTLDRKLKEPRANVNTGYLTDHHRNEPTLLATAADRQRCATMAQLITHGADKDIVRPGPASYRNSLVVKSIEHDRIAAVRTLLEHGASLKFFEEEMRMDGFNINLRLFLHPDMARLLVAFGAEPSLERCARLIQAILMQRVDAAKTIVSERGPSLTHLADALEANVCYVFTQLFVNPEMVQLVLDYGVDPEQLAGWEGVGAGKHVEPSDPRVIKSLQLIQEAQARAEQSKPQPK